jgi:hypothetical protein
MLWNLNENTDSSKLPAKDVITEDTGEANKKEQ